MNNWFKPAFVNATLIAAGALYLFSGVGLIFFPEWFFENFGNFPPYNRHYAGDAGTFATAIGIGLWWAATNPVQHRVTIGLGAIASLLHAINHGYDDLMGTAPSLYWLQSTLPLFIVTGLLIVSYWIISTKQTPYPAAETGS